MSEIAKPLKVGLIFGGQSMEHEVSLSSARSVIDCLDNRRYSVVLFGISKDGSWWVGPGAWNQLYARADSTLLPTAIRNLSTDLDTVIADHFGGFPPYTRFEDLDCVFPLVIGTGGEDGVLQGFCALTRKPVVGCGVLASALAFDKWATKHFVTQDNIAVVKGIQVCVSEDIEGVRERIARNFEHWDLFVKPTRCGSSFGVSRVRRQDDLEPALRKGFAFGNAVLVEEFVEHVELLIGVVGRDGDLLVSPPALSRPGLQQYRSYEDKYLSTRAPLQFPPDLDTDTVLRARELARKTFSVLGCEGFARVDVLFHPPSGRLCLNEVNTVPGISRTSAFPLVMTATGLTYELLLDRIISLALVPGRAS